MLHVLTFINSHISPVSCEVPSNPVQGRELNLSRPSGPSSPLVLLSLHLLPALPAPGLCFTSNLALFMVCELESDLSDLATALLPAPRVAVCLWCH